MVYLNRLMNTFLMLLKKTNLLSMDFIYRMYFMQVFGSKLYFRHKVNSFRSCAFCRHLSYNKIIKKYVCSHGMYNACSSLIPCIVPDTSHMLSKTYLEDENQIPWLFKEPCLDFDVLDSDNYFRNFISSNLNSSVIKLEVLEGIFMGHCAGYIPCHICAYVNKELYNQCSNIKNANESGKCSNIYYELNKCFCAASDLEKVSKVS